MNASRCSKLLSGGVLLPLALLAACAAGAQSIGSPIGSIAFKQDSTGVVNGFLIENLSDILPAGSPANVEFAHLSLTVGAQTEAFDAALGSPLTLQPGSSIDTTDPLFGTDGALQYSATQSPLTATLSGDLLDSAGKSLNLHFFAAMTPLDLTIPQNPGDVNAPVTIFVTAGSTTVPAPGALTTSLLGAAAGTFALRRRAARLRSQN